MIGRDGAKIDSMPSGLKRFQKAESHRNPVARGLVEKPEDWAWSSFRHYPAGVAGTVEIESHWTAFGRGNRLPEGVERKRG